MAGNSIEITRDYIDKILVKARYIDSDIPDAHINLWGKTFKTPIATAALSHLDNLHEAGMVHLARGAKMADAVNFCGMEAYDGEFDDIMKEGAASIRIIKPHANNDDVFKRIEHAKKLGAFAIGMDIDHAYTGNGGYDVVCGLPMHPKSFDELKSFVLAAGDIPFVVKGVLSVEDACKCVEMGAAGIVVSHHNGLMPYSVPPVMVLPEIKKAVGDKLKIFIDCGVESGMDAYKALALGADVVCVGRHLMNYLKEGGASGVANRINEITNELKTIAARTGFRNVSEIDDAALVVPRW